MPLRSPISTLAPPRSWLCTRSRNGDVVLTASKVATNIGRSARDSIEVFRVVNDTITEVWNCGYKVGAWQ
jgi:hypothetical protein